MSIILVCCIRSLPSYWKIWKLNFSESEHKQRQQRNNRNSVLQLQIGALIRRLVLCPSLKFPSCQLRIVLQHATSLRFCHHGSIHMSKSDAVCTILFLHTLFGYSTAFRLFFFFFFFFVNRHQWLAEIASMSAIQRKGIHARTPTKLAELCWFVSALGLLSDTDDGT